VVKSPEIQAGAEPPAHKEAKIAEAKYFEGFSTNEYWKDLGPGYSHLLGIPNLTTKLSEILCALNEESLPKIKVAIHEHLKKTRAELATMTPEEKGHPTAVVIKKLTDLSKEAVKQLHGDSKAGRQGFAQRRNAIFKAFRGQIYHTSPVFLPFTANEKESYRKERARQDRPVQWAR
jgi:hypothetical protein